VFKLESKSVFGDLSLSWSGLSVVAAPPYELVSISARHGQEGALKTNFEKTYGVSLPKPNELVKFEHGHIGWMGQDQWWAEFEKTDDQYIDRTLANALDGTASTSLQSDAWVGLDISGDQVLSLLERLIPVDTSDAAFPAGTISRTQMHHLGVFLLRYPNAQKSYRLMGARSSAQSLLHAVKQTSQNIFGDPT
jgi:sarcosine oxidase subunit gamma